MVLQRPFLSAIPHSWVSKLGNHSIRQCFSFDQMAGKATESFLPEKEQFSPSAEFSSRLPLHWLS